MTQARYDEWMHHMRCGNFSAAWAVSDQVLRTHLHNREHSSAEIPRHMRLVWDGSPLANKNGLVCCYHGLGDTIQFVRYTVELKKIGARVTLQAQPALNSEPLYGKRYIDSHIVFSRD